VIISTNAGLWRYRIGDTIEFTSLNPFRIKISGRTKHFINSVGEEVIVDNAERAITRACDSTGAVISDFTAAPVYPTKTEAGRHEWLIELSRLPDNMEEFKKVLDRELMELNSDYEAKRGGDLALKEPLIINLEPGTFYNWMKKRGKLGGQHKVPRLYNSRKYVDDIKTEVLI